MNLYSKIFTRLSKLRNKNLWKIYSIIKSYENSKITYKKVQEKKLKLILIHAFENSIFWKEKFINEEINPYSDKPFLELKKIIPVTKQDLINNNSKIQNFIRGQQHFISKTSGTSGKKLSFFKNEKWDSANRASIFQGYSWHDCNPWDFKIYFWGLNLNFKEKLQTRFFDFLLNRYRIFSYNQNDFKRIVKKKEKIKIIEGYSSSIYEFSKYVIKHNIKFPNLKLVKGTSETIKDEYRFLSQKAFGLDIVSEYGSAEAGIISFSCSKGNSHINELNVIVENIENEIIVTNLNSFSFPIIKYAQGDYIEFNTFDSCSCGINSKIIKKIIGRTGVNIIGYENEYASLLLYNVFKNINSKNKLHLSYTSKQYIKGKLEIYVSPKFFENKYLNLIKEEFEQCKYLIDERLWF